MYEVGETNDSRKRFGIVRIYASCRLKALSAEEQPGDFS